MRPTVVALAALLALAPVAIAQSVPTAQNAPVASLDLDRYAGTWHEIARLPMFFERHCVGDVTATYTRDVGGDVRVHNACRTLDGGMQASDGRARPVAGHPGALKIAFAPSTLQWLPFVWADYWVIDLDPDYRWAVVGSPSRKYLWILSREPSMPRAQFDALEARAAERGYPVERLVVAAPLD